MYCKLGNWELATEATSFPLTAKVEHISSGIADNVWLLFGKLRVIVSKTLS
ncbi:MAG: hypothetical protein JWN94_1030 [Betaproteobacteria bacterium]|nr:hypothetical protein [Betaproteobacteria bacterium]